MSVQPPSQAAVDYRGCVFTQSGPGPGGVCPHTQLSSGYPDLHLLDPEEHSPTTYLSKTRFPTLSEKSDNAAMYK